MAKQEVIKQVVGIDIGKEKFFACYQIKDLDEYVVIKGTKSFRNDNGGYKKYILRSEKRIKKTVGPTIYVRVTRSRYYVVLTYFLYNKWYEMKEKVAQTLNYLTRKRY